MQKQTKQHNLEEPKKVSEHAEQCEVVKWFRKTYPFVIFAIPNGGMRNIATAGRLKAEGALAGIPDLSIPRFSLFVEMKSTTGRISKSQKDMIAKLEADKCYCILAFGAADAKIKLKKFIAEQLKNSKWR